MKFYLLSIICLLAFLSSCKQEKNNKVAQSADYESYLLPDQNPTALKAQKELEFWTNKLEKSPTQYPYQSKIAGAHSTLFGQTGEVEHLTKAYEIYTGLVKKTKSKTSSYLRALARNCISQHKFREALEHLSLAEKNGDQLRSTQKMLFDVHLELGNPEIGKNYLDKIANKKDFDYKIRQAKWMDHEGNLDEAIVQMERALAEAKEKNNQGLILWSATNLGDFYGHAGRISDSYQQFLDALAIDPNNAYALKGIAWIAFSHDKNTEEAKRILKALNQRRDVPDYNLMLAEIAEYENNTEEQKKYTEQFLTKATNPQYGDMYNTYLAELEESPEAILKIAETEISNRPTPQSYALKAWGHYKNKDYKKALTVIEEKVENKTFEPAAQYKMAIIYKANDRKERTQALKAELGGSSYELGPVMGKKIGSL